MHAKDARSITDKSIADKEASSKKIVEDKLESIYLLIAERAQKGFSDVQVELVDNLALQSRVELNLIAKGYRAVQVEAGIGHLIGKKLLEVSW